MVSLTPAQSPLSHPSSFSLLICTSLSLLYSQHGVFHPCTAPLPAPPATLLGTLHMAPGPAPISVPTGVSRKGSAVPTRPSTAHLLCPWPQGVEVREGSASAALELCLRTGWTCWRFLGFCLLAQLSRGVRLGGLSSTRAHLSRGEDSPHHAMSPFCSLFRNRRRAPTPPLRMKIPKVPVGASGKVGRLFWRGAHGSGHPS